MFTSLISADNAAHVAGFLLELNYDVIQERYIPDVKSSIMWLRNCLTDYRSLLDKEPLQANAIVQQEEALLRAIRALLPYLNEQGQEQLQQFLKQTLFDFHPTV